MIDFHTHILPAMDDGAKDVAESVKMLSLLSSQGVNTVVASSHYYSFNESPQSFLQRRSRSFEMLKNHLTPELPEIVLGAEVLYFDGISNCEHLPLLCIENTNTLLLEMPFRKWNDRIVDEVLSLSSEYDTVLAHIERYFKYAGKSNLLNLSKNGVSFQINDTFFDTLCSKKKALNLISHGAKLILGSDCHNLTTRAPKIDKAQKNIVKKLGENALADMTFASKVFLKVPQL